MICTSIGPRNQGRYWQVPSMKLAAFGMCYMTLLSATKSWMVHTCQSAPTCVTVASLAPNITDLVVSFFSFLSYLLSSLIRSPFSLMTATLPLHQACTCPSPRAVHDFHFTSVLCTSMLLSFIYHMPHVNPSLFIKAVPSLWQCLMHALLRLDRVGIGIDSIDREIALRVIL